MIARRLRWLPTALGALAGLLAVACFAGCEAVPDIRFVEDDARVRDGGPDADAAPRDSAPGTCSGPSPGGGAVCCAPSWCVGQCDKATCDTCAQKCQQGEVCCPTPGTVVCKDKC